ncbi:tyrosine-type recombinase/integrase [Thalassoglobus sp.]|uniref:tyrosine-type recombinase/integrase n=1 Tax=Thalassoglobus sp. TaxID=2795869 RepID=UPI003AA9CE40
MASIFKRKQKKNQPYWIQYTDYEGKRKTKKGFTDKALTEQLASKLETEAMLRKTGIVDVEQEKLAEKKRSPLDQLIKKFEKTLSERSDEYVKRTMFRLNRIVDGCEFKTLGDINEEAVTEFLKEIREDQNLAPRTYNHYIQAIDRFCNWCVKSKRLASNPLVGIERLNADLDIRHPRRALSETEFAMLVKSARESDCRVNGYRGEERARVYITSYMTGLRRKELGSLTKQSFNLASNPPTVTVEAANSKHRKQDVLPLHPEFVQLLTSWLKGFKPKQKLFPDLEKKRTWLMVKKDLERVGIPYRNEHGIADFHAAGRHTHITELLRNGASLPEAQQLARHSDIKQTMKYTHIGIEDQAKAVANLPTEQFNANPDVDQNSDDQHALQMRCISGVFDQHSVSLDDTDHPHPNDKNPCISKGLGTACHQVAPHDKAERGGFSGGTIQCYVDLL